jgi:hypothetical protein
MDNYIQVKLNKIVDNHLLMDMEMLVVLLNKNLHLFQINNEDVLYQYHEDEFVHDHKEDQVMLHHNVIH